MLSVSTVVACSSRSDFCDKHLVERAQSNPRRAQIGGARVDFVGQVARFGHDGINPVPANVNADVAQLEIDFRKALLDTLATRARRP